MRVPVEDANGKISQSVYFANRNQVQASIDAMGFRTTYAHDLQGRLQSTEDANGHFVTNVYDSMGRLQFVKNALGENVRQYGYDLAVCEATLGELNS
jgi:YD repeat-containing protein